ncbi:MAG: ankyrin repeat domain-containing protein [Alphaproteobacteria bacterium]
MKLTKDQESLMDAIFDGNTRRVKALLKKGVDPDFDDTYGDTPLLAAARQGHLPIVKALIDGGADPHRTNYTGNNALDAANSYGYVKIAKYLEDEGVSPSTPSWDDDDDWMHGSSRRGGGTSKRATRGGGGWDDDDFGFDDDDDVKPKKKKAAPKKAAAKKPASPQSFGAMSDAAEGGATAAPAAPKITFREDNLKDIFNPKSWTGKTEDMEKLWEDVPARLKKKFDFAAALAEARRDTLKQNAPPQRLTLKPTNTQTPPPPPAAPPFNPDYEI